MHELDKKDNFQLEVRSLLGKLNERVDNFAQEVAVEKGDASAKESGDMNTLKLHRYKMKELVVKMEVIEDDAWVENRAAYQKDFKAAEKALEFKP